VLEDLIYDVGMHDGTDTDFYLKKGFRVVAIEANPGLVAAARRRFAAELESGRLVILNVAVAEHEGIVDFYVSAKDDWSTAEVDVVADKRSKYPEVDFEKIEVAARSFDSILEEQGIPYYMKLDIEGSEDLCLRALLRMADRPRYISVEIAAQRTFDEVCWLHLARYRGFKILDQRFHSSIVLPSPSRHGTYVAHEFRGHSTGPFGEETPGSWRSFEEILPIYRLALSNCSDAWFDLHATREHDVATAHIRLPLPTQTRLSLPRRRSLRRIGQHLAESLPPRR
jgi:FkbM family methyltransferase